MTGPQLTDGKNNRYPYVLSPGGNDRFLLSGLRHSKLWRSRSESSLRSASLALASRNCCVQHEWPVWGMLQGGTAPCQTVAKGACSSGVVRAVQATTQWEVHIKLIIRK